MLENQEKVVNSIENVSDGDSDGENAEISNQTNKANKTNITDKIVDKEEGIYEMTLNKDIYYGWAVMKYHEIWNNLTTCQKISYWLLIALSFCVQVGALLTMSLEALDSDTSSHIILAISEITGVVISQFDTNYNSTLNNTNYTINSFEAYLRLQNNIHATITDEYNSPGHDNGYLLSVKLVAFIMMVVLLQKDLTENGHEDMKYLRDKCWHIYLISQIHHFFAQYAWLVSLVIILIVSTSVLDTILNSVAITFILEFDNWLYDVVSSKTNLFSDQLFIMKMKINKETNLRSSGDGIVKEILLLLLASVNFFLFYIALTVEDVVLEYVFLCLFAFAGFTWIVTN